MNAFPASCQQSHLLSFMSTLTNFLDRLSGCVAVSSHISCLEAFFEHDK